MRNLSRPDKADGIAGQYVELRGEEIEIAYFDQVQAIFRKIYGQRADAAFRFATDRSGELGGKGTKIRLGILYREQMHISIGRNRNRTGIASLLRLIVDGTGQIVSIQKYIVAPRPTEANVEGIGDGSLVIVAGCYHFDDSRHADAARPTVWDTVVGMRTHFVEYDPVGGSGIQQGAVPAARTRKRIGGRGVWNISGPEKFDGIARQHLERGRKEIEIADLYEMEYRIGRYLKIADFAEAATGGQGEGGVRAAGMIFYVAEGDGNGLPGSGKDE